MLKVVAATVLMSITASSLSAGGFVYTNPRYETIPFGRDRTRLDTISVISCSPDPAYLHPSTLTIMYKVRQPVKDSLVIWIPGEYACLCEWNRLSHTWYGDFDRGDTVSCSFVFTPKQVGTYGVPIGIGQNRESRGMIPFGFTLDDQGMLVKGATPHGGEEYGKLGLVPQKMGDSLFFSKICNYYDKLQPGPVFGIEAKLSPIFTADKPGTMTYRFSPKFDADYGVSYRISSSGQLQIQVPDSSDWPGRVRAGDTLELSVIITPVAPGIASLSFAAIGYPTPVESETQSWRILGEHTSLLQVEFAIDENLSIIAYSKDNLYRQDSSYRSPRTIPVETSRLEQVESLPPRIEGHSIRSRNYDALITAAKARGGRLR